MTIRSENIFKFKQIFDSQFRYEKQMNQTCNIRGGLDLDH